MTELAKKITSTLADVERGSYRTTGRTSMQRFGDRLKRWREDRGYTRTEMQHELEARGIPCSSSHMSYWENGKRMPSPDTIDSICDILQISGAHLFGPDGPERDTAIAVYEVISALPEPHQRALQQLYEKQRERRARRQEDIRQQREDIKEMKKIFRV